MSFRKYLILAILLSLAALLMASNPVMLKHSSADGIQLKFQAPEMKISSERLGGESFNVLQMDGAELSAEDGLPEIPYYSSSIIMPPTGGYRLNIRYGAIKRFSNIRPRPVFGTEEAKSMLQYEREAYFSNPQPTLATSQISILRDFRILQLNINPVSWDAATGELSVYQDLDIEVEFTNESSVNELPAYTTYSAAFRKLYEGNLINFEDYRQLNPAPEQSRILLIHWNNTNAVFNAQLQAFITWKRQKGHEVNAVSTAVAGTSNTAIKNYIQTQYNSPNARPDYVILVGDVGSIPTWVENLSSYQGEGDYPYTFLAGNDMLGDVFIGRISVETVEQFSNMLSKVYTYEKDINNEADTAAWLNRILLIGDPSSSGISTIYTSKYIKEMALRINPNYTFTENYSGGFSSTINTAINQGVSFFSYRGYIGMSGWNPSSSLVNGFKLPHAVILTCGTGNFASSGTTELFTRLGTAANPAGAVTAMGMATSGTHTMFNNTLNAAVFNGIFSHKMRSMGEALLNARLYIKEVYSASHDTQANYFAHWCNLIGDPTMEVFIGIPGTINIDAPASLALGSSVLDISLTDQSGSPVRDASVTIYSASQNSILAKGFSDEFGNISLQISGGIQSDLVITASKNDYKPSQADVMVGAGSMVYNSKIVYDNGTSGSSGNSDGFASAGETIALALELKNTTAGTINGLSGSVSTDDPYVNILNAALSFNPINADASSFSQSDVTLEIQNDVPGLHDVRFTVNLTDSESNSYVFPVHITTYNAILAVENTTISAGGNSILDPAEAGFLSVGIRNSSVAAVANVYAELRSLNDLVTVSDSLAYVGGILAGALAPTVDSFEVFARALLIPGMQIPMQVRLFNDAGFEQIAAFNIPIGLVNQNTPLGPDAYGYFIYDVTDTAYSDCPSYEWIEINPAQGGLGTRLNSLNDSGTTGDEGDQEGSNALEVVQLPFAFPFYGVPYNTITVSTNGFIAMGTTANGEFRNSRMPGGLGPSPMIAAFWDDLIQISDAGVYKYYNEGNHTFIIEYYKMRNGYNRTSLETFQVIFYDPVYYSTSMGDGMIKIQYMDFNNVDVGGGGYSPVHGNYCTIGIKDHSNTRGLEYTYNNTYPMAAAPLSSQKALLISTVPVLHESPYLVVQDVIVNDPNGNGIVEPGETIELGIRLVNQGLNTATGVNISASMVSQYAQLLVPDSTYPNIPGDNGSVNSTPIRLSIGWDCPDNASLNLNLLVTSAGGEWTYPITLTVKKPQLAISTYFMHDSEANGNGLVEPGESFDLVINYTNGSPIDAKNISSNIFCLSEYVNIANPEQVLTNIPAGTTVQAVYSIQVSPSAPMGSNLTFYVTYLGELIPPQNEQLVISLGNTGMAENFEENNGNFVANPASNGWAWGTSTFAGAHSGTKVWGTRLNSQYPSNAAYTLTTPTVYIGTNFMLEFWHKYSMEATYDGGNVQISNNNGNSWNLLIPEGGYTDGMLPSLNDSGYSGNSGGWVLARFPLANYTNQNVQFRFTFGSDSMIEDEGWFIDDVRTSGYLEYAGKLSGNIISSDENIPYTSVLIKNAGNICAQANSQGAYQLFVPMGSHLVSAASPGYHTTDPVSITLSLPNPTHTQDFYMGYLNPPANLQYNVQNGVLVLNWEAPVEPEYAVAGYAIFRKISAGRFEQIAEVTTNTFSENLVVTGMYQYYVQCFYAEGYSSPSATIEFNYGGVDNPEDENLTVITALSGNYPNPFNPSTNIAFSTKEAGLVKLNVYNLKGQLVRNLIADTMISGKHTITWNGKDNNGKAVSSGIYLIRMETGGKAFTHKAMLMK